jgi:hypothetical protein
MTKCLLFNGKLFVLKYWFILIVLGRDTSKPGSMSGPRCVGSWFNRKIELNQKMLILKWFVTKIMFYVMMTTEMFINDFSKIKLCCLWRFDDKMSVIYCKLSVLRYCFIFIALGWYTSTPGIIERPQRCDRGVTGGRGITIHSEQRGN